MGRKGGSVIFGRAEAKALAYLAGHYGDEATAIRFAVLHEAARLRARRAAQRQAAAQGQRGGEAQPCDQDVR